MLKNSYNLENNQLDIQKQLMSHKEKLSQLFGIWLQLKNTQKWNLVSKKRDSKINMLRYQHCGLLNI
jgi:hypothetical protein